MEIKATHLDFTTVYGAARSIDQDELKNGLPLSRLLSLSQFIEALVLFENITYEMGDSDLWVRFSAMLKKSLLLRVIGEPKWLKPLDRQVDENDQTTENAVKWAIRKLHDTSLESLFYSTKFHGGTYTGIIPAAESNPFINQYVEIANSLETDTVESFRSGMQILNSNEIGLMGFVILVRLGLFNGALVLSGKGNYSPHYSRQPVILSAEDKIADLCSYTMDEVCNFRNKLLQQNRNKEDVLGVALSPILLATLNKAKNPEDLIENALKLRNNKYAQNYRKEMADIIANADDDPASIELYKARIRSRIEDLNDFLFEKGTTESYHRSWHAKIGWSMPLGWQFGWRRKTKKFNQTGDKAVLFFSDLIRLSMGVTQAQKSINDVFGISSKFDMPIISCASPDFKRRIAQQD